MESDNRQDVAVMGESASHVVRMVRQVQIPPMAEVNVLVTKEARKLVRIRALQEWDSSQVWTTASAIVQAFQNMTMHVIILNQTNDPPPAGMKRTPKRKLFVPENMASEREITKSATTTIPQRSHRLHRPPKL